MKASDDEELMICIGRITKELCSEATTEIIQKKLLAGSDISP